MKETRLRLVVRLIATTMALSQFVFGQEPTPKSQEATDKTVATTTPPILGATENSELGDRYRIGPGDILDIRVFNRPQLSREAIRVDSRGMIRVPLLQSEIQAACRTENELAKELDAHYLEYLRTPGVEVFVREYQSQPVAVLGAVNTPGRFQLQRQVRLLELLSFAGGPAERAGGRVQIVHASGASICRTSAADASDSEALRSFDSYNLNHMLSGDDASNPYVRPGDIVTVPESETAFVVGNVLKPSTIPLKEPITVTQAIAMAGGVMPDTKSEKVRIVRQAAGSTAKTEIFIDLKGIDKHLTEDVVLQANDIVDVPTSGGKRFLRTLVSAIAPAISNAPVRVITHR
jgi:polysaccharide biosynthesis/export protein